MIRVADQALNDIDRQVEGNELPRFLSRADTGEETVAPTPLTLEILLQRLHALSGVAPAIITKLAIGVIASFPPLIAICNSGSSPAAPPQTYQSAEIVRNEVAEALQIVELFEARAGFASKLIALRQETTVASESAEAPLKTGSVPPGEPADPMALIIVRHLPEAVTFAAGSAAGPGAWAIPAADLEATGAAFGDGLDQPAAIDVEIFSQAGLPLLSLCMELRKEGAAQSTLALLDAAVPVAVIETPVADAAVEDATPKKRARPAHVRNATKTARAKNGNSVNGHVEHTELQRSKRVRRTRDVAQDASDDDVNAPQTAESFAANAGDEPPKKPGLLTNFFAWLKGGKSGSEIQEEASAGRQDDRKAGLLRQH
jgi:hypothetical protein